MADQSAVLLSVVQTTEVVLTGGVAALLSVRLRRAPTVATAAAFGVFAVTATIILAGLLKLTGPEGSLPDAADTVSVVLLVALPPLLVLLAHALGAVSRRWWNVALGLYVAEILATLALAPLPDPDEAQPPGYGLFVFGVLSAWAVQSLIAAIGLWRAGAARSSVVRNRMRSLAAGAALLAVTLLLSGAAEEAGGWASVSVTFLGLASLVLLALAFLLPTSLKTIWRQGDQARLASAERRLMSTLSAKEVADAVLPALIATFGGSGAALLAADGTPRDSRGMAPEQLDALREALQAAGSAHVVALPGPCLAAPLTQGWLVVEGGGLAPLFGDDEAQLLERVATTVDLALQRTTLFTRERDSRKAAEDAKQELEVLLYSVSHDLRSPLISVLGYLDVLRQEHSAQLQGDARHYLERMAVNAVYMQELIADLLELSRVGRISDDAQAVVDLDPLLASVCDGARLTDPSATLRVEGPLPVVRMDDVRARQLFTNLVDNALRHGGRPDIEVVVSADWTLDGDIEILIADDGRGIPPEYRERVLKVFERLDAPKSSPGTGMGLAICKRIAESLGGDLVVDGPAGERTTGTTLRLTVPASAVVTALPTPRPGGTERSVTHV